MAILHLTRDEVVARALNIFPDCYYVWGGYPNHVTYCESKGGLYHATGRPSDCSGFCSWAWGLGSHYHSSTWSQPGLFGRNYVRRARNTGSLSERFPGISPGDVLVRWQGSPSSDNYQGHVALYIGNNQLAECYTGHWENSINRHGTRISSESFNFMGYTRYEEAFSGTYDDEEEDPITFGFTAGGQTVPSGPANNPFPDGSPGDISDWESMNQWQYVRRYQLCKYMRRR